jgi:hypothetical protein
VTQDGGKRNNKLIICGLPIESLVSLTGASQAPLGTERAAPQWTGSEL